MQAAMENGRCRFHGGRTPKGDAWGLPRWADKSDPRAMFKVHRKLKDRKRKAAERAKRVAAMTPEDRADYDRHVSARKPGPAVHRAAKRQEKKQSAFFAQRSAKPAPPPSPEMQELDRQILDLQMELAQLQKRPSLGVFD